jgi:DNA-binding transcriptional LysR family regulator
MDTARLEVFRAVARSGGFSAAARALGRSQPSVSQVVAALEEEVGHRLFMREGRRVVLTQAGQVMLEHADRIVDDVARAMEHLARAAKLKEGRLGLGTTDTLACHLLPPVLADFRRRYGGIELRIETRPSPVIADRVAARELDLGIITLPIRTRLATEHLVPHTDVVITPRDHPLATRKRLRIAELADERLILLDKTTATRAFIESELAEPPRVAMETSSVEVLIRLVELGFGISVVPEIAVRRASLARIPLVGASARHVGVVLPPGGPSRGAEAFLEIARARLL